MIYKVISFYKYTRIDNPENLSKELKTICIKLKILGRILVSEEGINAAVSGTKERIKNLKKVLKQKFANLTFREQNCKNNAYHKLVVRPRKEIVVFGKKVNLNKTGKHLSPKEFNKTIKQKNVVILDARNDYEYKVGKFEKAIELGIKTFKEFPKKIKKIEQLKNKKIVMYCTGGIRCEKASAFLKEKGFKHVYQLQGGIINYANKSSKDQFKGTCFVFDDRLSAELGEPISSCEICGNLNDEIINCYNLDCDKLFVCCKKCQKKMNKNCSEECNKSLRQRKDIKKLKVLGKVENYYQKKKIALVKVEKGLKTGEKVLFTGKTTSFKDKIKELRDYDGNKIIKASNGELITFPVSQRVRKNDKVCVEI